MLRSSRVSTVVYLVLPSFSGVSVVSLLSALVQHLLSRTLYRLSSFTELTSPCFPSPTETGNRKEPTGSVCYQRGQCQLKLSQCHVRCHGNGNVEHFRPVSTCLRFFLYSFCKLSLETESTEPDNKKKLLKTHSKGLKISRSRTEPLAYQTVFQRNAIRLLGEPD